MLRSEQPVCCLPLPDFGILIFTMEILQKNTTEEVLGEAMVSEKRNFEMAVLTVLVFLLPLFFIPYSTVGIPFGKIILLSIGVFSVFSMMLLRQLRSGVLSFPASLLMPAGLLVPLAYLASALMAPSLQLSFLGQGFEGDTVFTIFLLFLLFLLTASSCRTKGNAVYVFVALIASFTLLALFHVTRFFMGTDVFSFGIFTSDVSSPIGKWNDLGIFCGLIIIVSWFVLERLSVRGIFAWALWATLALSLFFLAVINFILVWIALGSIAALLLTHALFFRRFNFLHHQTSEQRKVRRIPFITLVIFVVSMVIVVDAQVPGLFGKERPLIGSILFNAFQFSQLEARPSWATTYMIGKEVYKDSPVLGSGPNTFTQDWLLHKPSTINQTIFWNTPFSSGIGFIPTAFITTGIMGSLAWIFFFMIFLYTGIRTLRGNYEDSLLSFFAVASFFIAAFLWFFGIFYTPSTALLVLAAIFSGIWVASLVQGGTLQMRTVTLAAHPRTGFAVSLVFIALLIISLVCAYAVGRKFISAFYFDRAAAAVGAQNLDEASGIMDRALQFAENDRYHQLVAKFAVSRISVAIAENPEPSGKEQEALRSLAERAVGEGVAATNYNNRNYYNWIALGRVYEALAQLRTTNAYENALVAYSKAAELNPNTPEIFLARARLEVVRGEFDKAREEIGKALAQKSDYTAAILLLAQIEIATGNTNDAIDSLFAAAKVSPANPVIFFQLGFLEYSVKNYQVATAALEQAVSLVDNYSNARYFLGLAYYYYERPADAIVQFERIAELNPDNAEVKQILENLKGGKDPLTGAPPPPPEKRQTPPFDN